MLITGLKLRFDPGEGTGTATEEAVAAGSELTFPENTYTAPSGSHFLGWQMENKLYYSGEKITLDGNAGITSTDVTVTAVWTNSAWDALKKQLAGGNGRTITLTEDLTAANSEECLLVPAGVSVTLDLNGHTLNRGRTSFADNGHVITVDGTLTLLDSSAGKTGKITGGRTYTDGGGVIISGKLNMYGGNITGNSTEMDYPRNMAGGYCGGVSIRYSGRFNMYGGSITDNRAETTGGAILIPIGGGFHVSGNVYIAGNSAERENRGDNVEVYSGRGINIDGELSADARITVSIISAENTPWAFTQGLDGNGTPDNFIVEYKYGAVTTVLMKGGELGVCKGQSYGTPDFTLPAALTEIDEDAFGGIAATYVYVPDKCRSIGPGAFRNCANLKQVRLPADCEISDTAFEGCSGLFLFVPKGGTGYENAKAYVSAHDGVYLIVE